MTRKTLARKLAATLLIAALFVVGLTFPGVGPLSSTVHAAGVKVTIPTFKVTLNGAIIDNQKGKYPLIVYKDITYFPMTYYDCRFLSVETDWQGNEKGLFIKKSDVRGGYTPYLQSSKNSSTGIAKIVDFPVTINGEKINNLKETYPLLSFRDITYFPMTWQYCVDEFCWAYSFDDKNGLTVDSTDNPVVSYGELPGRTKDEFLCSSVACDGEYAYYVDKSGRVVQMPLLKLSEGSGAKLSDAVDFYQLPISSYSDNYMPPAFFEIYGHRYFICDTGGVMGASCTVEMTASGFKEITTSRMAHFDFGGENIFEYYRGAAPGADNLYKKGGENIGDPNFLYGWNWSEDGEGSGGGGGDYAYARFPANNLYFDGDSYIYVLAFDKTGITEGKPSAGVTLKNGIYRVDLRNNETTRISPDGAYTRSFMATGGTLYFAAGEKYYSYDTVAQQLAEIAAPKETLDAYAVLGGKLYGVTGCEEGWQTSNAVLNRVNEDGTLTRIDETYRWREMDIKTDSVTGKSYLVVSCEDNWDTPYRLTVIDENGDFVLKNSDGVNPKAATVKGGKLYYYNTNSERICSVEL